MADTMTEDEHSDCDDFECPMCALDENPDHTLVSWTYVDAAQIVCVMYARVAPALLKAFYPVSPAYIATIEKRSLNPFGDSGQTNLDALVAQLRYRLLPLNTNSVPPTAGLTHPLHRLLTCAIYEQYGGIPYYSHDTVRDIYHGCRPCIDAYNKAKAAAKAEAEATSSAARYVNYSCSHLMDTRKFHVPSDLVSWADFSQHSVDSGDEEQEPEFRNVENAVHLGTVLITEI